MWSAALASYIHVLSLAIGLPAIFLRWRALAGGPTTPERAAKALYADNLWGISALTWLGSGLWRALGGTDKPWAFYDGHGLFWAKMTVLGVTFALELAPMVVLIGWRVAAARGRPPAYHHGGWIGVSSAIETALVLVIALLATLMARGIGY